MNSRPSSKPKRRAWLVLISLPLAVLSSEALAWWWKSPPPPEEGRLLLAYTFPVERDEATSAPVAKAVQTALSFDSSQAGWIDDGEGRRISLNYFEWNDVGSTGLSDAFGHPPELCMGNMGNKVQAYLPSRSFDLEGHELVFDSTQFRDENGAPLYIFKLSWVEGLEGLNLLRDGPALAMRRSFKINSVMRRWFPGHARVLMLGVFGVRSDDDAWELAKRKVLRDLTFQKVKS